MRISAFTGRSLVIVADSISKSFGGRRVLSSAWIRASRGEVVGLLGRMGSGKSTLLQICAGSIRADSGWVELDGERYLSPSRSRLASRGLFFLAETDNLAWTLTVGQHFAEIERRFGGRLSDEIAELVAIDSLLDRRPQTLSGGEVKRVEIALALTRRPLCLLADEPFRSVDPIFCELLGRCFRVLADQGCAVVVTGHEVNQLIPFLDSITWVTSGTTHSLGSTRSALRDERFRREYLGPSSEMLRA
jgi:lipopolysaccharide export system ATP-binding protein